MKKIGRILRSVLVLVAAALSFAATQDANAPPGGVRKVTNVVVRPAPSVEKRGDEVTTRRLWTRPAS